MGQRPVANHSPTATAAAIVIVVSDACGGSVRRLFRKAADVFCKAADGRVPGARFRALISRARCSSSDLGDGLVGRAGASRPSGVTPQSCGSSRSQVRGIRSPNLAYGSGSHLSDRFQRFATSTGGSPRRPSSDASDSRASDGPTAWLGRRALSSPRSPGRAAETLRRRFDRIGRVGWIGCVGVVGWVGARFAANAATAWSIVSLRSATARTIASTDSRSGGGRDGIGIGCPEDRCASSAAIYPTPVHPSADPGVTSSHPCKPLANPGCPVVDPGCPVANRSLAAPRPSRPLTSANFSHPLIQE